MPGADTHTYGMALTNPLAVNAGTDASFSRGTGNAPQASRSATWQSRPWLGPNPLHDYEKHRMIAG